MTEPQEGERSPIKVLYMHGGGANPATSYKAQYLMRWFRAECPHMANTSLYEQCHFLFRTAMHSVSWEFLPDVCVGTSLGGALLLDLIRSGIWRGSSILMCPAVLLGVDDISLSTEEVPIVLAHGLEDSVVSIDVSRAIAQANAESHFLELIEVEGDGHNMESVTQTGLLKEWVEQVYRKFLATTIVSE